VCQSELIAPAESSLDYYIKLQEDMEIDKRTDDDAQASQQQQPLLQPATSFTGAKSHVADKTSSMDALGFAAGYKFKVQKIVARPTAKH